MSARLKHRAATRTPGGTHGARLIRALQQTAVLTLAVLGFLFALLTSYGLTVETARVVWAALAFTALFAVVFSVERRGVLLLVCVLAAAFWIWHHAAELLQGLLLLLDGALIPLSLRLPDVLQNLMRTDIAEPLRLMSMALTTLLSFVALSAGYFVVWRSSVWGLALSTLPLLLPAPFFSLASARVPFFCLLAAHLLLFVLNGVKRIPSSLTRTGSLALACSKRELAAQRSAQQLVALFALPLIALTALLAGWILPERDYTRPESIEALQQRAFSLDIRGDLIWKSNDGLTRGSLRSLASIRFTGDAALKVRVSDQRPLYLRDFAGAVFTTDGWTDVSSAVYARYALGFSAVPPQNLLAAAMAAGSRRFETYTLSVRNVAASPSSLWTPPGLVTTAGELGAINVRDTALGYGGAAHEDGYTIEALACNAVPSALTLPGAADAAALRSAYLAATGSATGLSDAAGEDARQVLRSAESYIGYIFDVYTALPEETRLAAERLCGVYGLALSRDGNTLRLSETCGSLYRLLSARCVYAYAPPQIPADADFATYFLEESRRGYCVHFATTATVLLRALGIPARYAEGYIVVGDDYDKQPDAEGYIDIEDTHAHAWVEVFDPAQLEWIPVEMTASSSGGGAPAPDDTPEASAEPEPATPEPTIEPTPQIAPSATPTTDAGAPEPSPTAGAGDSMTISETSPTPGSAEQRNPDDGEASAEGGAAPEESTTSQDSGAPGDAEHTAGVPLWPLFLLLPLAGGPLLAFGWRSTRRKRLKKQFSQRNTNAAVLAICRFTLDALRFAGCAPLNALQTPEDYAQSALKILPWLDGAQLASLLELAQRARFSGKACARRERDVAAAFARSLLPLIAARLPRLRRWLFCWRYPAF